MRSRTATMAETRTATSTGLDRWVADLSFGEAEAFAVEVAADVVDADVDSAEDRIWIINFWDWTSLSLFRLEFRGLALKVTSMTDFGADLGTSPNRVKVDESNWSHEVDGSTLVMMTTLAGSRKYGLRSKDS